MIYQGHTILAVPCFLIETQEEYSVLVALATNHLPGYAVLLSNVFFSYEIAGVERVVSMGTEILTRLNDIEVTASSALALMEKHLWIHFACHGVQDSDSLTQSAFMVYDGGLDFRS